MYAISAVAELLVWATCIIFHRNRALGKVVICGPIMLDVCWKSVRLKDNGLFMTERLIANSIGNSAAAHGDYWRTAYRHGTICTYAPVCVRLCIITGEHRRLSVLAASLDSTAARQDKKIDVVAQLAQMNAKKTCRDVDVSIAFTTHPS